MQPSVRQGLANDDIVEGWRFSATLQLRTPLHYLKLHGVLYPVDMGAPPEHPVMHGTWVIATKPNAELGIELPDLILTNQTCASEIGQVPRDGGDFLKFLIAVRSIAESAGTGKSLESMVRTEISSPKWNEFVMKLGGAERIIKRLKTSTRKMDQTHQPSHVMPLPRF